MALSVLFRVLFTVSSDVFSLIVVLFMESNSKHGFFFFNHNRFWSNCTKLLSGIIVCTRFKRSKNRVFLQACLCIIITRVRFREITIIIKRKLYYCSSGTNENMARISTESTMPIYRRFMV